MDARDWEDRACISGDSEIEGEAAREIAHLNATLCYMMADLIRLLDQPFRRVPGPR